VVIVTDVTCRIIPNRLVFVVLFCGLGLRLFSGFDALLTSLLSATAVLAALSLLGANDLLGWGDVKLIAAVTFVVPANRVIPLLFDIALAGGLLSCLYMAIRLTMRRALRFSSEAGRHIGLLRSLARQEVARVVRNEPMPYALAIAGGVAYGLITG
jgi:prepilin peptidase CpaA